jgi:hypothetical protein
MNKFARASCLALFACLPLAGCAADMGGVATAASVTRFHLGQQIARGPIAVESADPDAQNSLEFSQVASSVGRELARLGWAVDARSRDTEQVAVVRVEQALRQGRRSGLSVGVGIGGGSFGRRGGVGVGVGGTVPVGGAGPNQIVATQLNVRIQRRSDATVAWEGRAEMEARGGTELAGRAAAADRLAWALFRDFPGESGRTIRVR